MRVRTILGIAVIALLLSVPASAILISVDEEGHGINTLEDGVLGKDPGPGGQDDVLIFKIPFKGTQGDVRIDDGNDILDIIRFNGDSTLIFYSDRSDPQTDDAFGDAKMPTKLYDNLQLVKEEGTDTANEASYTPAIGDPGYDASGPSYRFVSDGLLTPEPSPIVMFSAGGLALAIRGRRRCGRWAGAPWPRICRIEEARPW